jgi:hypothetical protein
VVIAWLQRHERSRAAGVVPALVRVTQRFNFRMGLAAPVMPAFTQRDAVANDHASHRRIRRRVGDRARG